MPVKALIIDPKTGRAASVVDHEECSALAVATKSLKTFRNKRCYLL